MQCCNFSIRARVSIVTYKSHDLNMMSSQDDVLLDYTLIQVHERPLNDIMIKSELDGETFPLSTCKFDLDNPAMPSDIDEVETICMFHYPRGQPLKRSTQGSINASKCFCICVCVFVRACVCACVCACVYVCACICAPKRVCI